MKQPLFEVKELKKYFHSGKTVTKAVDGVSFHIYPGEVVGVVGESGCGKTTCGRTVVGLYDKDGGQVLYKGEDVHAMRGSRRARFCREVQTIFQDPYSSLDSRNHVCDLIAEGLDIQKLTSSPAERLDRVKQLMSQVGLNLSGLHRYPHEFSGGMRQRIGIARALAVNPEFILCDEPISALDVSIQAQIINLLMDLREDQGLTYLMISHDLSMVKHVSDRIIVMYLGKVVETCPAAELYAHPAHPYTQALISAIPIADPKIERQREHIILSGQVPSPSNKPKGCAFAGRCRFATDRCREEEPCLKEVAPGHTAACHLL
ncbi:MAG: ATP-binding cassette domain-containing protein [Oscillospiraceae bacterium]|nr:ATP-binding cassette domain-containing protein [Oscillospiraceae bacterium]